MKELIEKGINLGIGIAATTKEKVESRVDELIKKGQLAKENRSKAVNELLDTIEKNEKEFEQKASAAVNETINNFGFATRKEIDSLSEKVSDLQKQLGADQAEV
jgi:polyhydroxyalkanoate synthesis regulator phasin